MSVDSLGDFLRQEREKRGITLEQVASATKINVRVLHLLESDQYSDLPAKPFVRGFVMSYARFVGLDVQDVLTRFAHFLDEKVKERPKKDAGHTGYAFEKKETEQSRTWLWTVLTTFAVVGSITILFLKPKLGRRHHSAVDQLKAANADKLKNAEGSPAPAPPIAASTPRPSPGLLTETSAALPSSAPKASPKPSPSPKPTPTPKPTPSPKPSPKPTLPAAAATAGPSAIPIPNDPLNKGDNLKPAEVKYKAVLKAIDDIYARYTVDGKTTTIIVLRKGSLLMLKAKESIILQVSDPERVYLKYRTNDFLPLNQVQNLTQRNEMTTIIRPVELVETTQDPFPGARRLFNPPPHPQRSAP